MTKLVKICNVECRLTKHERSDIGVIFTYGYSKLTQKQYNDVYTLLCGLYPNVEHHTNINLINNKLYGYFKCTPKQ